MNRWQSTRLTPEDVEAYFLREGKWRLPKRLQKYAVYLKEAYRQSQIQPEEPEDTLTPEDVAAYFARKGRGKLPERLKKYADILQEAYFWSLVEKSEEPDGCWLWRGNLDLWANVRKAKFKYPRFCGRSARQFAIELEHGNPPSWTKQLSKIWYTDICGEWRCVRPSHMDNRIDITDYYASLG